MNEDQQSGTALLLVLVILAGLSLLSLSALEGMTRSRILAGNAQAVSEGRWIALGALDYARAEALQLREGGLMGGDPAGRRLQATLPVGDALVRLEADDASGCLNLNSTVAGAGDVFETDANAVRQPTRLLSEPDLAGVSGEELAVAIAGWIAPGGGEDALYLNGRRPFLTGEEPLAHVSEILSISGFSPDLFDRLKPFVCALPVTGTSPVNLNALKPDAAIILTALSDGAISTPTARALLESRPGEGWKSFGEAFASLGRSGIIVPDAMLEDLRLQSDFLRVGIEVRRADAPPVRLSALLVWRSGRYETHSFSWTADL